MRGALILLSAFTVAGCLSSPALVAQSEGFWLAGDTHVHTDHSSDGSLPRQSSNQRLPGNLPERDQIAEAVQNHLDFLALTDHRTYDQHWDPQWTSPGLLLVPGEEANGSPHAIILGGVDHIVDGANPSGSASFRHLQQSVWDAHAQDAVWSVAHPDNGEQGADGRPNENASVLGIDAVEAWNPSSNPDAQIDYAENRWNRGFRMGIVAASDNHYRELWAQAGPGKPVTWVFAKDRSPRAILDALRAGHTAVSRQVGAVFATLEGDFDGDGIFETMGGDERVVQAGITAQLRVSVRNGAGTSVYVYRSPGRASGEIALFHPTSVDETFLLPVTVAEGHTWYRVEVRAPGELSGLKANPLLKDQLRAAASPVFITTGRRAEPDAEIALPPADSAGDGAMLAVAAPQGFSGFADISVSGDVPHVVAEVHREGKVHVVYGNHRDLSSALHSAGSPRVAASGAQVWVVWQQEREPSGGSDIYIRHSSDGGATWQAETVVSNSTGRAMHPAIALLNESCPVVAWSDNVAGAFDIWARVLCLDSAPNNLSASGKTIQAGNSLDARSPRFPASLFPSVAVNRSGNVVVAWQDNRFDPDPLWTGHTPGIGEAPGGGTDPDNWEILASVRAPLSSNWREPMRVSGNDDAADRHPSVAFDATGTLVMAWDTQPLKNAGVNLSIRSRRSSDAGATWSDVQSIGLESTAMSQRPRLAAAADGTIQAVWYDSRASDWRWQVFTSRLEAGNWTPAVQLTHAGNSSWPAVSQGAVVFTSDRRAARSQRDPTQEVFIARGPLSVLRDTALPESSGSPRVRD